MKMIKYKMAFTITAEQVFHLISKLLPIEDLEVAEFPDPPPVRQALLSAVKRAMPASQQDGRKHRGPDLERGINGIIVAALRKKDCRASELEPLVTKAKYSPHSVCSRLEELRRHNIVKRERGLWSLVAEPPSPENKAVGGIAKGGHDTA